MPRRNRHFCSAASRFSPRDFRIEQNTIDGAGIGRNFGLVLHECPEKLPGSESFYSSHFAGAALRRTRETCGDTSEDIEAVNYLVPSPVTASLHLPSFLHNVSNGRTLITWEEPVPQAALIVDDDLGTCELIQAILQSADIEAIISTDSSRAAKLLHNEEFDAFFFDVNMPALDGIELTRLARSSPKNRKTPIIIITGEEAPSVMQRAFQAGANFLLFKPINRERLLRLSQSTKSVFQKERRHYQRVVAKCKVKIQADQETLEGESLDLSLNGLMVRAAKTLPLGRNVHLEIHLSPSAPPIKVQGKVVRLVGADMGIHLEDVPAESSQRLQDFLLPLLLGSHPPSA